METQNMSLSAVCDMETNKEQANAMVLVDDLSLPEEWLVVDDEAVDKATRRHTVCADPLLVKSSAKDIPEFYAFAEGKGRGSDSPAPKGLSRVGSKLRGLKTFVKSSRRRNKAVSLMWKGRTANVLC